MLKARGIRGRRFNIDCNAGEQKAHSKFLRLPVSVRFCLSRGQYEGKVPRGGRARDRRRHRPPPPLGD